jgi:hypothetical protein
LRGRERLPVREGGALRGSVGGLLGLFWEVETWVGEGTPGLFWKGGGYWGGGESACLFGKVVR